MFFINSKSFFYKVFDNVIEELTVLVEKDETVTFAKTPDEIYKDIEILCIRRQKKLNMLINQENAILKTKSWKVREHSKDEMINLLYQFVADVDYLNDLQRKYRKFTATLPDSEKKCSEWDNAIHEEEARKERIIEKVKTLYHDLSTYNPH